VTLVPKRITSKAANVPCRNCTVISVGANPELLSLREAVLQKAGFKVVSTDDAARAMGEFRSGNYEVMVLCQSLAETVLKELTREFHESRVVIVTNERLQFAIGDKTKVVYGIDGPETLVEAIRAA